MGKPLKILFLSPRLFFNTWPLPTDLSRFMLGFPAVTFPQLAATLSNKDTYDILDGAFERCSRKEYIRRLSGYDVVAISFHSGKIALNTLISMNLVRALSPNAKIILGGQHATAYHRTWLGMGADAVIRHEGEQTFPEYLETVRRDEEPVSVKGISYRWKDEIRVNPDRPFIENLDELPLPDWSKMNLPNYHLRLSPKGYTASVESARGCPFACDFCATSFLWKHKQRYKSVDRVIQEMEQLYGLGVRQFAVVDDNFGMNSKRDTALAERIIKRLPGISWWSFMRADTPLKYPEIVKMAARSGLKQVIIGFESLSAERLKLIGKGYKQETGVAQYREAYRIFRENGIFVIGEFIVGLPGETEQERQDLITRTESVCDCVTYNLMDLVYGTKTGDQYLEETGLNKESIFYNFRGFPQITPSQETFISKTYIKYFLRPSVWSKMFSSDYVTSIYMRNLYWTVLSNTANITSSKIHSFLLAHRNGISLAQKKTLVESHYLGSRYLNKLLRNTGVEVSEDRPKSIVSAASNQRGL